MSTMIEFADQHLDDRERLLRFGTRLDWLHDCLHRHDIHPVVGGAGKLVAYLQIRRDVRVWLHTQRRRFYEDGELPSDVVERVERLYWRTVS